ncbi:DUF115 domain-containing protein [Schleiferiaceae bacterium]|nr:DUF115 domain-containing protein [Schleiferiaceae bacterium]
MRSEILKKISPLKWWVLSKLYVPSKYLNSLRGLYKGETIFVVCNGPSLNSTPLDKLKGVSIGMNKIHLIFDKVDWRPNWIIVNNGLVVHQLIETNLDHGIQYLLDFKSRFFPKIGKLKPIYFLSHYRAVFSENVTKFFGSAGTVTFSAIQLAVFLGARRIIIVGMDHNYMDHDNGKSVSKIEKFKGKDINHFDPNYFQNHFWGTPNLYRSEEGYRMARRQCENLGIEIFDCTIDGKCKIFEKRDINEFV